MKNLVELVDITPPVDRRHGGVCAVVVGIELRCMLEILHRLRIVSYRIPAVMLHSLQEGLLSSRITGFVCRLFRPHLTPREYRDEQRQSKTGRYATLHWDGLPLVCWLETEFSTGSERPTSASASRCGATI